MNKITNYEGSDGDNLQEFGKRWADPTWPSATLGTYVENRLEELREIERQREAEGLMETIERKVVSVRLSVRDIHYLDQIAKKLQNTRSGLATEILEVGIEELRAKLGIPRLYMADMTGSDEQTTVLKDGQTGEVLGTFQDDALQIGGGDR